MDRLVPLPPISCNWVLNEADMFKSSSVLIYSNTCQSIFTQLVWHDAMLIVNESYVKGPLNLVKLGFSSNRVTSDRKSSTILIYSNKGTEI